MADINVTPLVDVVLVLLIIFMVITPLLTAGVPVDLPDSRAKALEQDAKPINLSIERGGGVYLDDAQLKDERPARHPRRSRETRSVLSRRRSTCAPTARFPMARS